jgi:hypothetical protein
VNKLVVIDGGKGGPFEVTLNGTRVARVIDYRVTRRLGDVAPMVELTFYAHVNDEAFVEVPE